MEHDRVWAKTELYMHEIEHSLSNNIYRTKLYLHEIESSNLYQSQPLWAKWMPSEEITHLWLNKLVQVGRGLKIFTHLVFDWFQYKRYERKFPHNLNISIQIFLRVLLYQFLLDRQNGDTTICQMSDTGLGFQSYFFCPYWFNCKSLPFFYFLTFEKGRLPYIHPVGRSVGRRHH